MEMIFQSSAALGGAIFGEEIFLLYFANFYCQSAIFGIHFANGCTTTNYRY
jgi:uncharacterized membrane protein YedE/YeeE